MNEFPRGIRYTYLETTFIPPFGSYTSKTEPSIIDKVPQKSQTLISSKKIKTPNAEDHAKLVWFSTDVLASPTY